MAATLILDSDSLQRHATRSHALPESAHETVTRTADACFERARHILSAESNAIVWRALVGWGERAGSSGS